MKTFYFLGYSTKLGEDIYETFGAPREFTDKDYADLCMEHGGADFVSAEDLQAGPLQLSDFERWSSAGSFPETVESLPEEEREPYMAFRKALENVHERRRTAKAEYQANKATAVGTAVKAVKEVKPVEVKPAVEEMH